MNRRQFIAAVVWSPVFASALCRQLATSGGASGSRSARFFFVSQGKTALMNSDGTGLRYFDFKAPNQVTLAAWSRRYQIDERAYKLFKWLVPPRRLVDGGRFSFY